jgi:hypothetical protein
MCIFGGGSTSAVRDPQAEQAQETQMEKEKQTQQKLKDQQTQQQVVRATPLVSTNLPEPKQQTTTVNVPGGQVDIPRDPTVVEERKQSTVLQRRRMRRGRRSLITGSGGGIGYYRGSI